MTLLSTFNFKGFRMKYREFVKLCEFEELSYGAIANELGINNRSARQTVHQWECRGLVPSHIVLKALSDKRFTLDQYNAIANNEATQD
jgi:predicted DNA-binding transcriptional regulator